MTEANLDQTLKELKHEKKLQNALKKREKKESKKAGKLEKKETKKEHKAQKYAKKAGLEYEAPRTEKPAEESGDTFSVEWSRRSTVSMDKVERKLDNLFEPRGEEIRKRWQDKFGDEPDIPEEYVRPKVDMGDLDRTPTKATPAGSAEAWTETGDGEPAKKGKLLLGKLGRKKGVSEKKEAKKIVAGEPLPLMALAPPLRGLWLYQKFGVGKNIIVKIIILIISLIGYIVFLLPRLLFLPVMLIKKRKAAASS